MQIIIFTLSDKHYAITTDNVNEITKQIQVTMVPNSPAWVEGLINLRGNVITLLNLSKLLHQTVSLCYNNIIILNINEEKIGLMVEDVDQILDINSEDIQKLSTDSMNEILGIIKIDEVIINIIDIEILMQKMRDLFETGIVTTRN